MSFPIITATHFSVSIASTQNWIGFSIMSWIVTTKLHLLRLSLLSILLRLGSLPILGLKWLEEINCAEDGEDIETRLIMNYLRSPATRFRGWCGTLNRSNIYLKVFSKTKDSSTIRTRLRQLGLVKSKTSDKKLLFSANELNSHFLSNQQNLISDCNDIYLGDKCYDDSKFYCKSVEDLKHSRSVKLSTASNHTPLERMAYLLKLWVSLCHAFCHSYLISLTTV